LMNELEQ